MTKRFPELPDWLFEVDEVSAGVYEATATDKFGHRIQMTGTDYDELLADCRKAAADMEARLRDNRP
jgi:hypothetical protein